MAACRGCGTKVSMFSSECEACERTRRAAEETAARNAALEQAQHREQRQRAYVEEALARLDATLMSGRNVSLYESVYVPVDSAVNDDAFAGAFDLLQIQTLGWAGWDVVGVVPRTIGVGLMNNGGGAQSWGAGMGGNVAGVHILLCMTVRPEDASSARPVLEDHLARTFRG